MERFTASAVLKLNGLPFRMKVTESSDVYLHFTRYSQLSLTYLNLAVEHKKPKINIFLNANIKKGKTNANNHSQSKYLHSVFRQ